MEPGHGYVEALAGLGSQVPPFARLEAGWRPRPELGLFGYGQLEPGAWTAGAGARWTW